MSTLTHAHVDSNIGRYQQIGTASALLSAMVESGAPCRIVFRAEDPGEPGGFVVHTIEIAERKVAESDDEDRNADGSPFYDPRSTTRAE